jgi:hypothetical protein
VDNPSEASGPPARPRLLRGLLAAFPFVLTALIAVAATLLLQPLVAPPVAVPTVVSIPTPATRPPPLPATALPSPAPPSARPDERVLAQEVLDLRALSEQQTGWLYLLKAIDQIRLAEEALALNDMGEVDRALLDVDVTLGQAYERSSDAARDPIQQLREQLGLLRDDLYVRPEGADQRLRRLRQNTLSLINDTP